MYRLQVRPRHGCQSLVEYNVQLVIELKFSWQIRKRILAFLLIAIKKGVGNDKRRYAFCTARPRSH